MLLQLLDILLTEEGVHEVILYFFEWLHFSEYRSDYSIISHIFKAMVQCGRDDPVSMDPWSFEQEIVRRVSVDDIARYFWFQVSNLASEMNLA